MGVCGCEWFLLGLVGGSHYQCRTQPATMTAFISVEPWEAAGNSSVVLNCMQDTTLLPDPPPPLILSATLNGEHHMVKQQASHDNKGRYLTGTLELSYRSANLLRQITTMVESVEQQNLDGLGTSWTRRGRRVELRSGLGSLTLKHLIADLHVTVLSHPCHLSLGD